MIRVVKRIFGLSGPAQYPGAHFYLDWERAWCSDCLPFALFFFSLGVYYFRRFLRICFSPCSVVVAEHFMKRVLWQWVAFGRWNRRVHRQQHLYKCKSKRLPCTRELWKTAAGKRDCSMMKAFLVVEWLPSCLHFGVSSLNFRTITCLQLQQTKTAPSILRRHYERPVDIY